MWDKIAIVKEQVFIYIRNIFYCSLIFAVGSYIHAHPPGFLTRLPFDRYWGYPIIIIGLLLFLLNLVDALNCLLKTSFNIVIKVILVLMAVYLTGWLVMVVWMFKVH